MTEQNQRKQLLQSYRQQNDRAGVFRLYNAQTKRQWIEASADVQAAINRVWFELKLGKHKIRTLQDDYARFGESALHIEILEKLIVKDSPTWNLQAELAHSKTLWQAEYAHQAELYVA